MTTRPNIRRSARIVLFAMVPACLLLVLLSELGLLHQAVHRAGIGDWRETKAWKKALLHATPPPEIVFVGSSRTQNHIDTHMLSQRGMPAFNYGIPRMFLADYPSVIRDASAIAPRRVVISIPAGHLFSDPGCPSAWRLHDALFYARYRPSCLRQPFNRLKETFNVNSLFVTNEEAMIRKPCTFEDSPSRDPLMKKALIDYCKKDRMISSFRGGQSRMVVLFANGDGEIISNLHRDWSAIREERDLTDNDFHPAAVRHLEALARLAREAGAEPLIIIEPDPVYTVQFKRELAHRIGTKVIYLNSERFSNDEIADELHLSASGKRRYTERIHAELLD